jgi:hypothetical protein
VNTNGCKCTWLESEKNRGCNGIFKNSLICTTRRNKCNSSSITTELKWYNYSISIESGTFGMREKSVGIAGFILLTPF